MGGGAVSTKNFKRNSGGDRGKRKKAKSRKRRRVSSSPSSYSSDDDHRGRRRRRISRRETRSRRGRESGMSEKRKSRKARRRSVSSSSRNSSSSCSTCRSRSPSKMVKPKFKERGRKMEKVSRSSRSRLRSRSCSTCSEGGDRSSSLKARQKDDTKRLVSSSMESSPNEVEERYGSQGRDPVRNDGYDRGEEQVMELGRWMDGDSKSRDLYFVFENGLSTGEEKHPRKMNSQYSGKDYELESAKQHSRRIKSEIVFNDKHETDSNELDELILRQKALENLKKFHGKSFCINKIISNRENALSGDESFEQPCKATQSQHRASLHEAKLTFGDLPFDKRNGNLKFREANMPGGPEEVDDCIIISQHASFQQNNEKAPHDRYVQHKTADAGCGTSDGSRREVSVADGRITGNTCPDVQNSLETVVENQSGSQFEQKTFSRMHDGEMVQVSYKVYIPKKPPALARRKLQR